MDGLIAARPIEIWKPTNIAQAPEMEILLNKGRNESGSSSLNYYAVEGNIHIMDNHLGAVVPLDEIGKNSEEITFYHIDRHYDLGGLNDSHREYVLNQKPIPEVLQLDSVKSYRDVNVFLWDNYLHLFYGKFYEKVKETYFITHQTTQFLWQWGGVNKLTSFQLLNHHPNEKGNILNLDIDFFFHQSKDGKIYKAFSAEFINGFRNWFSRHGNKFDLIIIALSPECCDGWNKSIEMFKKIFPTLELDL